MPSVSPMPRDAPMNEYDRSRYANCFVMGRRRNRLHLPHDHAGRRVGVFVPQAQQHDVPAGVFGICRRRDDCGVGVVAAHSSHRACRGSGSNRMDSGGGRLRHRRGLPHGAPSAAAAYASRRKQGRRAAEQVGPADAAVHGGHAAQHPRGHERGPAVRHGGAKRRRSRYVRHGGGAGHRHRHSERARGCGGGAAHAAGGHERAEGVRAWHAVGFGRAGVRHPRGAVRGGHGHQAGRL